MDKVQQEINRRLAGLAHLDQTFKATMIGDKLIGDAFNLQTLARLLVLAETQDDMTPQMTEAVEYAQFVPVRNNFPAVVGTSHDLQRKRGVGEGKAHSGTGNDIPLAEVLYDSVSLKVKAGVIGYQYSIMELATASAMGVALDTDKIQAARLGFEKHMSRIAWYGETETGLKGLLNQTGVDTSAALEAWETATPDEILDDINGLIAGAMDASEYNASITPDTLLLPTSLMRVLTSRRISDNIETTIFKHIMENNMLTLEGKPFVIRATKRLETVGVGGTRRTIMYRRDPACIEMRIPQELQFLAGQAQGLDVFFPGHYLYQGIWLKRVDSLRYMDVPQKP